MAPTKRDKQHPDGAKPGTEAPAGATDRYAFDADQRAKTREDAVITLAGKQFYRRRKNWEVTRQLRALLRKQEKAGNRSGRLRAQIDALTEEIRGVQDPETGEWKRMPITDPQRIEEIEAQVDELNDKIDEAGDEADLAAYEIVASMVRDQDDNGPEIELLKAEVDVAEIGDLAASLAGGGEVLPDPFETGTSSDS